jgi:type I restriction enzyme R subunit
MSTQYAETEFQKLIVAHLAAHGWEVGTSDRYDRERAVPRRRVRVARARRREEPAQDRRRRRRRKGRERILKRLADTLAADEQHGGGTLTVLRKGFDVVGAKRFRMIQQPPADDRNPAMTALYAQNILRVVPELRYSTKKDDRLDLAFFVNGIPVATVELKTNFAQSLPAAIAQYKRDRHPQGEPLLTAGRGALVHFALTQDDIAMTTRLVGDATTFLPFNRGHDGGAGNPPNGEKPRTAYFWEDVLDRDAWLQILTKFVYTNHEKQTDPLTGKVTYRSQIRFPRFHQWRASPPSPPPHAPTDPAIATSSSTRPGRARPTRSRGPPTGSPPCTRPRATRSSTRCSSSPTGRCSTGSCRMPSTSSSPRRARSRRSPAGLRLEDSPAHRSARLGRAHHRRDAADLPARAAADPREGRTLAGKRFAVIADEAHSSQSGAAAGKLKELLYLGERVDIDDDEPGADQDALVAMAAHADSARRLSFFAFTATPKAKTLELFGTRAPTARRARSTSTR